MDTSGIGDRCAEFLRGAPLIRRKRKRRIVRQCVKAVCLVGASAVISAVAHFDPFGWALTLLSAVFLSAVLLRLYELPRKDLFFLGRVVAVRHDYRFARQRGTGGWAGPFYTTIREKHTVIVTAECVGDASRYREVALAPRYERVFVAGTLLLLHPDFSYPAVLSQGDVCTCVHCGAICPAESSTCDLCGTPLFTESAS